jgi:hypothetical protein
MSPRSNRQILAELDHLAVRGILTPTQAQQIATRYPTERWDVLVLVRWFTILGAVTAGAGVVLLAKDLANALRLGEIGLAGIAVGFVFLAGWLVRVKGLQKTSAALEMVAGFALQGLTFLLAIDFSTGSENWPALVGVQALLLAGLAYLLRNRLVLIHSAVCFFLFFGGETGYVSGWGAYWMSLNYPLRFIAAGLAFLGVAWLHAAYLRGAYQSFTRVYAHFGLLVVHLALWFLAVFGYFEEHVRWDGNEGERVAFSVVWAITSAACLWFAGTSGQRMLRGYGLTFLIINVYTFYFQFVVAHSAEAWWLHLLLVGGTLVWLGFWLERRLRYRGAGGPPGPSTASPAQPL